MRIHIRVLSIVLFVLSLSSFAFAEGLADLKGVQLQDGSVVYGKVIETNINNVIIEKNDGSRISVKFNDVAQFLKDEQTISIKDTAIDAKHDEVIFKPHTFEIGPEISFIEYKEPGVMQQEGTMVGIEAAYTYHNGIMSKVAGKFSYGQIDYQNSGTINNIDNHIFEIRALGGYDFKTSNSFTITPFIGLGYRFLEDDGAGKISSTGHYGYLRESNYYYSPIGIEAVNVLDKGWSTSVILEYDYFWKGEQKTYLSDANPGFNDITSDQNSGYGLRGSISIKKQTKRVFYAIEPFIKYWNIDNSDIDILTDYGIPYGLGLEPKNESTEIGVKFIIGF